MARQLNDTYYKLIESHESGVEIHVFQSDVKMFGYMVKSFMDYGGERYYKRCSEMYCHNCSSVLKDAINIAVSKAECLIFNEKVSWDSIWDVLNKEKQSIIDERILGGN